MSDQQHRSLTPLKQVQSVRDLLAHPGAAKQVERVAASTISPERLVRMMATAFRKTPKLADCEPMSFLGALMECAQLGLEPNTPLGHAWIVPFDNRRKVGPGRDDWQTITEATVIIGYRGMIELARRSGQVTGISAGVHYNDDELWDYEKGTESRLRHREGPQQGEKLHAYAIVQFKDGGSTWVVYPWSKVMSIRDGSQGWKQATAAAEKYNKPIKSPWATHEDEMAMKTMIRALQKYLPMAVEGVHRAAEVDGARLDYRAFANDPTADPTTIEGTAAPIDEPPVEGEVEDEQPAEEGDAPAAEEGQGEPEASAEDPVPQEEAAPPAESQAKQQSSQQKKGQGGRQASSEKQEANTDGGGAHAQNGPDRDQLELVRDRVVGDLADAGAAGVDEVLNLWRDQIDQLDAHAPDLKQEIDDAIAQTISGGEGGE